MLIDDFLVVLGCCLFWVERSKEFLSVLQVVVGPLRCEWDDECVVKEISAVIAGGAAMTVGGRTTLQKRRQKQDVLDPTKGYKGQDIISLCPTWCL